MVMVSVKTYIFTRKIRVCLIVIVIVECVFLYKNKMCSSMSPQMRVATFSGVATGLAVIQLTFKKSCRRNKRARNTGLPEMRAYS